MSSVVLVLCLMVVGFAIVASLAATRPSARPDVAETQEVTADELSDATPVAAAPTGAVAATADQPLPSVIDD